MAFEKKNISRSGKANSILVVIVFFLFIASLGIAFIGILDSDDGGGENVSGTIEIRESGNIRPEEESLEELFRKEFSKEVNNNGNYSNDPFREICGQTESGGAPVISSYTVCYY